jgi:hypothetical protein
MTRKVLIGTPAHAGTVDVWYVNSLTYTVRLCMQNNIDLREVFLAYDAIVQNARNDLVKIALEHKFDDLIFIDADQDWKPEWVLRLLNYPVDCVGAAVRKKTDQEELYNVRARSGPDSITTDPVTGLMTAPDMALGTGFLRLSRKALQVLWDNSEKYVGFKDKSASAWIFDIRPVNGELVGEDTAMSDKLRVHGIETYLAPGMTCGHIGPKKFVGDFDAWLKRAQDECRKPSLEQFKVAV